MNHKILTIKMHRTGSDQNDNGKKQIILSLSKRVSNTGERSRHALYWMVTVRGSAATKSVVFCE